MMSNPSTTTLTTTAQSPTPQQAGVKRKRGPPAPLNLASSSSSASLIVFAGPDRDDDGTAPADIPPAMPQPEDTTSTSTAPAPTVAVAAPSKPSNPSRNVKRLSLSISGTSIPQNLAPSIASPIARDSPQLPQPRRPSIASLPGASASSILRRNDEGDPSASAYLDGPIEIMPGIWLGSEDNARDWQGLIKRGIKSILNVAKEVASPFESASQPTRNTRAMSVPNAQTPRNMQSSTYQPAHLPSGRPPMHYLKLPWSHGQSDLVHTGFAQGIKFADEALARKEGVLIHCQCGVSRSATMVIALVMRAAAEGAPHVPPEVLALRGRGMQAAYDYVQQRSKTIGPNMSLIYQLLDYERALKGQDSPGRSSTGASEDEEWERRRQQLDSPNQESQEILKEAKELDREMEERRARRLSLASTSSNPSSFTGAIGNGAPWRVRYGSGVYSRSRAPSMESSYTSRSSVSVVSEDPLEEEDETDDRDPTKVTTPDTDATDEDAHCYGMNKEEIDHPQTAQAPRFKASLQPPTAPPTRTSFGLAAIAPPPSASPFKQSFGSSVTASPPSRLLRASAVPTLPSIRTEDISGSQNKKEKRRPPPLKDVTPTVPFPSIQLTTDEPVTTNPPTLSRHSSNSSQRSAILPSATPTAPKPSIATATSPRTRRLSQRISSLVPFPVKNALAAISSVVPRSPAPNGAGKAAPTPSASQTLFIFPPSPRTRGTSTPATLTLTSTPLPSAGFGSILTPRAGLFRRRTDSRMSWFGMSAATPTTATARVDVKGHFDAA